MYNKISMTAASLTPFITAQNTLTHDEAQQMLEKTFSRLIDPLIQQLKKDRENFVKIATSKGSLLAVQASNDIYMSLKDFE